MSDRDSWVQFAQRAQHRHIPICTEETRAEIEEVLQDIKPALVCEIGGAVGYSGLRMASTLQSWGGKIVSFEVSYPSYRAACRWRKTLQCWNSTFYHVDVLTVDLEQLCPSLDFVFIDGMKAQYGAYLSQIRPCCHTGSVIIADDVQIYGDKMEAFFAILEMPYYNRSSIPQSDGDALIKIVCETTEELPS